MAIPETGALIGTPPSINANVPAQTVAIEEDPFDSRISLTNRMVYGQSAVSGRTPFNARSARFPCPTSRRLVPLNGRSSPVENGGKL